MSANCDAEELRNLLIDEGILMKEVDQKRQWYNLEWEDSSTGECIEKLVNDLLEDCPNYVNASIQQLGGRFKKIPCLAIAKYWAGIFANLLAVKAVDEDGSVLKCGHAILAIRHSDGWGWGGRD